MLHCNTTVHDNYEIPFRFGIVFGIIITYLRVFMLTGIFPYFTSNIYIIKEMFKIVLPLVMLLLMSFYFFFAINFYAEDPSSR